MTDRVRILFLCCVLGLGGFFMWEGSTVTAKPNATGIVTKSSVYGLDETIDRLEAAIEKKGLKLFTRIDHGAGAASAGMELGPTILILFGNPQGGTPLMQSARTAGLDLPLKALVFQDTGGQVRVAYTTPSAIALKHKIEDRDALIEKMTGLLNAITDDATL